MANQSTLAGKKAAQVCGLRGHMCVALQSKIWSHVTAVQIDWSHRPQEDFSVCNFAHSLLLLVIFV